jgi:hypothetical protein
MSHQDIRITHVGPILDENPPTFLVRGARAVKLVAIGMIFAAFGAVACRSASVGKPSKVLPAPGGQAEFFERGLFYREHDDLDRFIRGWYSNHLTAMEEPSLVTSVSVDTEIYRFLWLRTFHHPIAVRITRRAGATTLHGVRLDGAGGYDPGKITDRFDKPVSAEDFRRLQKQLDATQFWTMPTLEERLVVADGARWIIEGWRNGARHVTDRWTPSEGPYRKTGLLFLELAGWSFPKEEVY